MQLQLHAAYQLLDSGYPEPGLKLLRALCATLGVHFPVDPGVALASLPFAMLRAHWDVLVRGRQQPGANRRARVRLQTAHTVAFIMGAHVPLHAASATERYLGLAQAQNDRGHQLRALGLSAALWSGVWPNASRVDRRLGRMRRLAQEAADPTLSGIGWLYAANVAFNRRRFETTREHSLRALEALRGRTEVIGELEAAHVFAQLGAHACGDYVSVQQTTPELIDAACQHGRRWVVAMLSGRAGAPAWLAPGDPAAYRRQLDEAHRLWPPRPHPGWAEYLLALGEAALCLYLGDPRRGAALLETRRPAFQRSTLILLGPFRWDYDAMLAQCRAAALCARPDPPASRALENTLGKLRRKQPTAAAIASASLAIGRRDSALAVSQLRRALAHSDTEGTQMHSAAIQHRLGNLVRGDEGAVLVRSAEASMRARGIADLDAMTELNCPGCAPP